MSVAITGTRISTIALPWFVLVTTGSATQTGLVAFCEMAPYVLVKMFSGPLVDRVGPRLISWTTDLVSALAVALVPLLHWLDLLPFWGLLALVAVIGSARGPGDLAKEIMIPEAADRSRVPLERATGLSGTTERLASTIGPAAGGALVALLGPMTGLAVNAACFALGSLLIWLLLPRGMGQPIRPESTGEEPEPGYWQRFREGFAFLRGERLLLAIILVVGVTNLLDAAFATVLLPVWAKESDNGAAVLGLLVSTMGGAAVLGSLIAATIAHRMRRRPVFFIGFALVGAPRFLVLAMDVPLVTMLAVFAIAGFGSGFLNPILGAIAFERVPRRLLGRVNALGDSVAWAGIPFGGLLAGAAISTIGLSPALVVAGTLYFLTTNLGGLRPEWREMDKLRGRGRAPDPPPGLVPDPNPGPAPGPVPVQEHSRPPGGSRDEREPGGREPGGRE
ncbi:MFS transporter [Streptomyces sp. P38-E01]|uniref:MFS transporter n=1 Tax=Streptomyces tardus TaxID=2780544 RepID=A0A949JC51_9ACTN|nr:MFS transporter [Streptomyces tardus]MBU7596742.1 MFS transporter [Streptomyces tardus]